MDMAAAFRTYRLDEHDAFGGQDDEDASAVEVLMFGSSLVSLD